MTQNIDPKLLNTIQAFSMDIVLAAVRGNPSLLKNETTRDELSDFAFLLAKRHIEYLSAIGELIVERSKEEPNVWIQ